MAISPSAILVVTDAQSKVTALIDPFDSSHPNPSLPPVPREGQQPFVLQEPSAAERITFTQEQILPQETKAREFFEQLEAFQDSAKQLQFATTCTYSTQSSTIIGYSCKQYTGFIFPACDAQGPGYKTDYNLDQFVDDSGF